MDGWKNWKNEELRNYWKRLIKFKIKETLAFSRVRFEIEENGISLELFSQEEEYRDDVYLGPEVFPYNQQNLAKVLLLLCSPPQEHGWDIHSLFDAIKNILGKT